MTFVLGHQVLHNRQEWGVTDWFVSPLLTNSQQLVIARITLDPGQGHAFHVHPKQEEAIVVLDGQLQQWIEHSYQELSGGEAVHIPAGVVHASFNNTAHPVHALVCLGPCVQADHGYEQIDMSKEEPWRSLRPMI